MDLESIALWGYKHVDIMIMTLVCLLIYVNLPDLLVELCRVPYGFALLISFVVIIVPPLVVWSLLVVCAAKSEVSENFKTIIKAMERGVRVEEFKKLDSFYVKAHIVPHTLIQLSLIMLLLLLSYTEWLVRAVAVTLGVVILPLFIPLISRSLSEVNEDSSLGSKVMDTFNIKVNFVGTVESPVVNAYVVSSPLYKVIYFTTEALKLKRDELCCLLAHELYHLKYNNTYLSSVILLAIVSLTYAIVLRALEIRALSFREGLSLATLVLYLLIRLLPRFVMREFEIRADIFAARVVGHVNYLKFLAKLKMTGFVSAFFSDAHPDVEKRIKIVKEDLKTSVQGVLNYC